MNANESDAITLKPKPYIATASDGALHFAVRMRWNADGFYEPSDTGLGRFENRDDAIAEAKAWATEEKLAYRETPPNGVRLSKTALNPAAAWPFPTEKR